MSHHKTLPNYKKKKKITSKTFQRDRQLGFFNAQSTKKKRFNLGHTDNIERDMCTDIHSQ